jgi:hypothetical protein
MTKSYTVRLNSFLDTLYDSPENVLNILSGPLPLVVDVSEGIDSHPPPVSVHLNREHLYIFVLLKMFPTLLKKIEKKCQVINLQR